MTVLAASVSCGGSALKSGKANEIKLGISGDWQDPGQGFPTPRHAPIERDPTTNKAAPTLAITGATVMTATGSRLEGGTILLEGGSITYVGQAKKQLPPGARIIDGTGRFVTPGLIDTHSHIGVFASPAVRAHSDGNEMTAPTTPQARAAYGYWPQDPAITRASAGGVTTAQILPGSANLIGGRGTIVAMQPGRSVDEVQFPGAPATIKMACGENPKWVYREKGGPQTRMAEYSAFRQAFHQAAEYRAAWQAYNRGLDHWRKRRAQGRALEAKHPGKRVQPEEAPTRPVRDLGLETLSGVLSGEILVQVHCYRASDLREMVAIADEFGFKIRSFHHALEAYKVRDLLIQHEIAISTWADWWGFKMEALDGIPQNAALFHEAGGRAAIHSDSSIGIQHLNQEAAKAMYAGQSAHIEISEDQALRWVTANPAWVLGISDVTGTLEVGKRADVVLWSGNPFSAYAKADLVISAGDITFDRSKGLAPTDFELGNSALEGGTR